MAGARRRRPAALAVADIAGAVAVVLLALTCAPPRWAAAAAPTAGATAPVATLSFGPGSPGTLSFEPAPSIRPTRAGPALVMPRSAASLTLVAVLPSSGTWLLSVAPANDLVDAVTGVALPSRALKVRVRPSGSPGPQGCSASGWQPVGSGGSRIAVLHGPGVCRLRVALRWAWSATAAPGRYRGVLSWSLSSVSP